MFPDDEEINDTNAQESDDSQDGSEEVAEKEVKRNEGIEKRIAELTKQSHDREREANQLRDLNMQLLAQRGQPAVVEADPYEEVEDPKLRELLKKRDAVQKAAFEQRLNQTTTHFESQMEAQEVTHAATNFGLDAEATKEAATIVREARRRGIPVNKEEVLDMVIGKAVREGKYTPVSGVNNRRAAPLTGNRQPNFAAPEVREQKPLPSNYEDLLPEQQLAILEKRGVGNQKL